MGTKQHKKITDPQPERIVRTWKNTGFCQIAHTTDAHASADSGDKSLNPVASEIIIISPLNASGNGNCPASQSSDWFHLRIPYQGEERVQPSGGTHVSYLLGMSSVGQLEESVQVS